MNDRMQMGMAGLQYEYRQKDPSVDSADDAVAALKKRAETLRANLNKVPTWKAELDQVERMLAAAEGK